MGSGRKTSYINMFALFLFFISHTIIFCSVLKVTKCIKVKNKYTISNKIVKTLRLTTRVLWFIWFPISCYFSTMCFQFESYGKGITSFLLFRCFLIFWNIRAYFPFWKLTGYKTCHLTCSRSAFWWRLWGHQLLSLKNGNMVTRLLK